MDLSDEELSAIHSWLVDWIQSSEYYSDHEGEDGPIKSGLFSKVTNEAKRRGFWWAR